MEGDEDDVEEELAAAEEALEAEEGEEGVLDGLGVVAEGEVRRGRGSRSAPPGWLQQRCCWAGCLAPSGSNKLTALVRLACVFHVIGRRRRTRRTRRVSTSGTERRRPTWRSVSLGF